MLTGPLGGGLSVLAQPLVVPLLRFVRFPLMSGERLVLRVLNGKEAATCAELRELATEAVMWQAVPVHLRAKVRGGNLLRGYVAGWLYVAGLCCGVVWSSSRGEVL
jgi:hypothetical protein